jgi:hypothetical protein
MLAKSGQGKQYARALKVQLEKLVLRKKGEITLFWLEKRV